jgi:basic amino acid/polyamine antiporter, APA family
MLYSSGNFKDGKDSSHKLVRGLGLAGAISVNIANMIGTGIFLKARAITCNVGTPGKALAVWILAGLLSLLGALTYAELLTLMPRAAGEYGILRDSYGRAGGFIYGWTQFVIVRTASAAALAVGFAIFFNDLLGGALLHFNFSFTAFGRVITFGGIQLTALLVIVTTAAVNCASVSISGRVAIVLTILKVVALLAIVIGALVYSKNGWENISSANQLGSCEGVSIVGGGVAGFGAALLGALWAYDGWNNVSFLAGEVKCPARNLPFALVISISAVLWLYALVNLGYYLTLNTMEITSLSTASSVGVEVVRRLVGRSAVTMMAAVMMISSLGALQVSMLATARVPYAMACDGLFIKALTQVSQRSHVPIRSLIVHSIWASLLALSGSYDALTDYVVFTLTLFYALVAGSLLIFRRRLPFVKRPYRTLGYPIVPLLFGLVSLLIAMTTISNAPIQSTIGLGLIALGYLVYLFWNRRKDQQNATGSGAVNRMDDRD